MLLRFLLFSIDDGEKDRCTEVTTENLGIDSSEIVMNDRTQQYSLLYDCYYIMTSYQGAADLCVFSEELHCDRRRHMLLPIVMCSSNLNVKSYIIITSNLITGSLIQFHFNSY
jgi:hypothetical protein